MFLGNVPPMRKIALNDLKRKIHEVTQIGAQRGTGEIVMITDASDVGGGATLFQWQTLESEQIPIGAYPTTGINPDGTMKSDHPPTHFLVPLGNWNWKWSETRQKYHIWELEMLSGVLTLAANFRIVAGLPLVWLTDNEALSKFLDQEPPLNKRQRRWFVYLSQFPMKIFHLPGAKNELTDYMSRELAENAVGCPLDDLAKQAFTRMDAQLDLCLDTIFTLSAIVKICAEDYTTSELADLWNQLVPNMSKRIDGWLYFRTEQRLFRETKILVPQRRINDILTKVHETHNHPGTMRTVLAFLANFSCDLTQSELIMRTKTFLDSCATCLLNKPNRQSDRGELGSLPTPTMANDMIYIDFVSMDPYNGHDYVLVAVDALTHFVQIWACQKTITGEGVIRILIDRWFRVFGKPIALHSDNNVRWKNEQSFYRTVLKSLNVQTHFGVPRHPQSNGVCENVNRQFLQNMRCLLNTCKTNDWVMLVPFCTWVMNSQVSQATKLSPCEMFTGKPPWKPELVPEPCTSPPIDEWLKAQLAVQSCAAELLCRNHEKASQTRNQYRMPACYNPGDYTLVHNHRWPQRRWPKLAPHWQGPFKVVKVAFNSLEVMASPSLGGMVKVSIADCKKWSPQVYDVPIADMPADEEMPEPEPILSEPMDADDEVSDDYRVKTIIDHKWRNGWKVLVAWDGFPADQATWEPPKNFISPNGAKNIHWKDY